MGVGEIFFFKMVAKMAITSLVGIVLFLAALDTVSARHKIVTYWGQNAVYGMLKPRQYWEKDLVEFCRDYNYDTIILSFLNVFFDHANKDQMPGFNFAFHCEKGISAEYPKLFRCPKIEEGIKECQKHGKTVLMSLGGAVGRAGFANDGQAKTFAYRLYHLLLEGTDLQSIRPFGTAVLDGIDLDIEGGMPTGYSAMVKELRRIEKSGKKRYTISAAPQCPYPDAIQGPSPGHFLGDVPELIDEVYVQFYNNWCQAGNANAFWDSFNQWIKYSEKTNGPKIFIGVPAERRGANIGYITPDKLKEIYDKAKSEPRMGGIMMWDASFDQNNIISGKHFSEHVGEFIDRSPHPPTKKPITLSPKTTKPGPTTRGPTKPYHKDCKGVPDGLYPQPDCRKYIQCAGGRTYPHQCPTGLWFNPKIGACDWPAHVDCVMPKRF